MYEIYFINKIILSPINFANPYVYIECKWYQINASIMHFD